MTARRYPRAPKAGASMSFRPCEIAALRTVLQLAMSGQRVSPEVMRSEGFQGLSRKALGMARRMETE